MDASPAILTALAAALAVTFAAFVALLARRSRDLHELREILGLGAASSADDVRGRLRELLAAARAAESRREALGRDLSTLLEATGVGVVRVDATLVVTAANRPAHAIVGRAHDAMIGRPLVEALVEPRIEDIARVAVNGGRGEAELLLGAAPGGRSSAANVRVAAVPATGGAWLLLEDVSELVRLRRIRAEFVDNLSHELRTPVTTIGLLAESLARDADGAGTSVPGRMRERIAKIEVETGHLAQMVAELLDLARIESGGGAAATEPVDLASVARLVADRLGPFAEREGVGLVVDVPASVPAVRGDEEQLGRALSNMLHNAIKFSGGRGRVTVAVRHDGDEVVVSVVDEGIGIRGADQARIFERFYKVDRARVRGGGTGLGLSIARHIVESHGGRIWVVSEEGAGSTFSFALPVAPVAPTVPAGRAPDVAAS